MYAALDQSSMASKEILRRVSVDAAKRSRIGTVARVSPFSKRMMAEIVVFILCASCSWVSPAALRASIMATATSRSGSDSSEALRGALSFSHFSLRLLGLGKGLGKRCSLLAGIFVE